MDAEDDELQDGLWEPCTRCGHSDWFHPEMAPPASGRVRCAECDYDLGPWDALHARLFTGRAMLAEALGRKP